MQPSDNNHRPQLRSQMSRREEIAFRPGYTVRQRYTTASLAARVLDVDLCHNELQLSLYDELTREHGKDSVATEWKTDAGRVDVVVRHSHNRLWFYEIKTALSARACIREGLAQLLEYSYWPGAHEPEKLLIVGEPRSALAALLHPSPLNPSAFL